MAAPSSTLEVQLARYQDELPREAEKTWKLLQEYSNIPASEIESHLRAIRDKAWEIYPYGCIGRWRFLDLYVTDLPVYAAVVDRLRHGDRLLDVGCFLGHVLRQLAADGVPASQLAGTDLRPAFVDLGYELFRDRDRFAGHLIAGDLLQDADPGLAALDGRFDVLHAASLFHLFGWDDQVRLGVRLVRFFRAAPTAADGSVQSPRLLFGRQSGNGAPQPPAHLDAAARTTARAAAKYFHSPGTLQQLWDEIGQQTNTRWTVEAALGLEPAHLTRPGDERRAILQFAIYERRTAVNDV